MVNNNNKIANECTSLRNYEILIGIDKKVYLPLLESTF